MYYWNKITPDKDIKTLLVIENKKDVAILVRAFMNGVDDLYADLDD